MVEKINYKVLDRFDSIEIRRYPSFFIVSTRRNEENNAFGLLFNYIKGDNKSRKKIAMTAPVISSEKIPMTTPVISTEFYMAFALPVHFTEETVPTPINPNVNVEQVPDCVLAVIRFSGRSTKKSIEKYSLILKDQLHQKQLKTTGDVFLFRYNSPFTPGFLRRNELAVELVNYNALE